MIKYSNFVDFIIILPIRSFNITNIFFFLLNYSFKKNPRNTTIYFKHVLKEHYEIKKVINSSRLHDANRVLFPETLYYCPINFLVERPLPRKRVLLIVIVGNQSECRKVSSVL